MGFSTIITYTALAFSERPGVQNAVFILSFIDIALAWISALFLPCLLFSRKSGSLSTFTAVWLQPSAAPIIAAAGGSIVANVLDSHRAFTLVAFSYITLGLGMPTFFLMIIYLQRLLLHGVPTPVITSFLPAGPCGQTAFAIVQLARVLLLHKLPISDSSLFTPDEYKSNILTLGLYAASIATALVFIGIGFFWLAIGAISLFKEGATTGVPFSLSWWGTTFPIATLATSTLLLSRALDVEALRVVSMIISCFVIFIWIYIMVRTLLGFWSGKVMISSAYDTWVATRNGQTKC